MAYGEWMGLILLDPFCGLFDAITSAVGDHIEIACHPDQLADGGGSG
jgi:hypothetical protein